MTEAGLARSTSKESIISAISHVGDWAVGDRCQIGGRVGNIVYVGPTQFAPGEWIGIVLDHPLGKNDGSVDGHRYFSCEPNHGLFCKASKLEHVRSPSPPVETSHSTPFSSEFGMEIGDRVIISGDKYGTLRFLGHTEFKDGVWAGIELDQPVGKNDGSVQGKRYFACKAPYGLFAAASKVMRAPEQSPAKIKIRHTKTSALRQRSGSHESMSSVGASSVTSSRLSKFNFGTPRAAQRPVIISSVRGQEGLFKSLQDSLKEKETHLEQMIRERDIERNDMAALSNRCEEAEAKVAQLENAKTLADQQIETLKIQLLKTKDKFKEADDTISDLTVQLKEKKDALEDLMFRCDEETILNAELKEKIEELEKGKHIKEIGSTEASEAAVEQKEKMREQLETLKKHCSILEQERHLFCGETKNILSAHRHDFNELLRFVLPDSVDSILEENEASAGESDQDLSAEFKKSLEKVRNLLELYKTAKQSVWEKLERRTKEKEDLTSQLEILRKSLENKSDVASEKDKELKTCHATMDQLRKQLEQTETERGIMKETHIALELTKNVLEENLDSLHKRNTELMEKMENERKEHGVETAKLKEDLQKLQNEVHQLREQHERAKGEKAKLMESREFLEKCNQRLLIDMESLKSRKNDLENKVKQQESEKEALNLTLARNEAELSAAKCKVDEFSQQVVRLRASLCEASSADESLKRGMELLHEENKRENAAHVTQVAELRAANGSLKKELSAVKNNFQTLESTHNALKDSLERTQVELRDLKEKLLSSQQELSLKHDETAKLQQEITSRVEALGQVQKLKDEEAARHTAAVSKLQSEKENIQQKLRDSEAEKTNILKERDEMSKEHAKVKERYVALTQTLKGRVGLANDSEEKAKMLATRIQNVEKCLSSVDCKGKTLDETVGNLLAERSRLLGAEEATKKEVENLKAEKEKQTAELTMMAGKISELEMERDTLISSFTRARDELVNVNESLAAEQKDKNILLLELNALKATVANVSKMKDETAVALDNLMKEKPKLEQEIALLEKERSDKNEELCALKLEVTNANSESKNRDGIISFLEVQVEKSKKENEELRAAVAKLTADLAALNLQNDSNDKVVAEKNVISAENAADSEKYQEEIGILKEEKSQIMNQLNFLKLEFLELAKKQAEDEATVLEAKQRNALFLDFEEDWRKKEASYVQTIQELKTAVGKTETEKIEEMKRDISFLNSIIAEQYKKEKDLKEQIAILNSIPANETLAELHHKITNDAPPRLYCDICEEFDLHDTTDCPAQAMDVAENAAHTHNSAKKELPAPRPYCDGCEEFGHETSACLKTQALKSKSKDYTF